jgi:hypothetical protein
MHKAFKRRPETKSSPCHLLVIQPLIVSFTEIIVVTSLLSETFHVQSLVPCLDQSLVIPLICTIILNHSLPPSLVHFSGNFLVSLM